MCKLLEFMNWDKEFIGGMLLLWIFFGSIGWIGWMALDIADRFQPGLDVQKATEEYPKLPPQYKGSD